MNIKHLMTTSVAALTLSSAAQAADVVVPAREMAPAVTATTTAPAFSWTGFYIGGQIGGFSSKVGISEKHANIGSYTDNKDGIPQPSGFMGGAYAGSNIDLGNGLVLGIETGAVWADQEKTGTISSVALDAAGIAALNAAFDLKGDNVLAVNDRQDNVFTYKEKWSGATRVRVGWSTAGNMLPYVAGGVAYAQMQGISTALEVKQPSGKVAATSSEIDETATMVGYTVGGGIDFAVNSNVVLRAEYRYSDFGKKKFSKENLEVSYKTNDFRVGVAYKF
ncbi:outer membrane protein [Bartonella sp. B41]